MLTRLRSAFDPNSEDGGRSLMPLCALLGLVISFGSSIILARIYDPALFGVYAIWMSINSLCLVPSMLGLESAVAMPKSTQEAEDVTALACLLALASSVVLAIVVLLGGPLLARQFGSTVQPYLLLSPFLLAVTSLVQGGQALMVREGRFYWLAVGTLTQTVLATALKFLLIPLVHSTNPLILSELPANCLLLSVIFWQTKLLSKLKTRRLTMIGLMAQLGRYRAFISGSLPGSVINSVNAQLPIFLLTPAFGEAAMGHYARAMQLIGIPITVFSNPIAAIFTQEGSQALREKNNCRPEFIDSLKKLLLIGIPCYGICAVFLPMLVGIVFGPKWIPAGEAGQRLALWGFFGFVAVPLGRVLYFSGRTLLYLTWVVTTIILNFAVLWWSIQHLSFLDSVLAWCAMYAGLYIIMIGLSYWASNRPPLVGKESSSELEADPLV